MRPTWFNVNCTIWFMLRFFLDLWLTYLWHLELYLVLSKHLVFLVLVTTMLIRRSIPSQIFVFLLKRFYFRPKISFRSGNFSVDECLHLPDSFRDSSLTRVFKILPVSVSVLFICNFRYLRFVISFICFWKWVTRIKFRHNATRSLKIKSLCYISVWFNRSI